MEHEKVLLTQSGVEKLEQERDNLINVERPKVIEELQLARSQGDLSENADYDAATEKDAEPERYQIVGYTETDPLNGKISNESPLAKAVLGHGVNEIVTVGVADPYDVKIVNIEFKN